MTLSELIGQLLGWVGEFVAWIISWVPHYDYVRCNQRGVKYTRGKEAVELLPGTHWYIPAMTDIVTHFVRLQVLTVEDLSLETADGVAVEVGMVCTLRIVDVLKYEVENLDADENMAEAAQAAVRDVVMGNTWEMLVKPTDPGRQLEGKLRTRMNKVLEEYGAEVIRCRPTDQVRLDGAFRLFGVDGAPEINVSSKE